MDALCLTRPDAQARLHRGFLQAGCDVVETHPFQASRLRLEEWGLADKTYQINAAGAAIARRECDAFEQLDGRPRFVAGSIGPTGLLPSSDDPTLSNISFRRPPVPFHTQTPHLPPGRADPPIADTPPAILQ